MSTYTVVPIKTGVHRYTAPVFYIEAQTNKDAVILAREKSGLGRFNEEWNFHVIETSKVRRGSTLGSTGIKTKPDPKSNRSIKRKKRGFTNSRPVRRALRRLSTGGLVYDGQKQRKAMKMW